MRVAPIPKALLPDTCAVRVPKEGEYAGGYEAPVTVSNVRFVSRAEAVDSGWVFADGSKGVLFVDAVNSEGAFAFPVGSLVELGGEEHMVRRADAFRDFSDVHHWEVELG